MSDRRSRDERAPTAELGTGRERWRLDENHVDMTAGERRSLPTTLEAEPQSIRFDLARSALVVIDMQNDFCTEGGWADTVGFGFLGARQPIEPLRQLLPVVRETSMRVVWLNWGNRADLLNLPPNVQHIFNPSGDGTGIGDPLPASGVPVLQKDSWAAAVVEELEPRPEDVRVDKYRISGFWDTPLDSILRNLDVRTVFFAGVNTDQCVLSTLQDASFLGYGCVLLEDCCATSSPDYCTQATLFNVKVCYGFVAGSAALAEALES